MLEFSVIMSAYQGNSSDYLETAIEKVVAWTKVWSAGGDVRGCMDKQITEFLEAKSNGMEE